MEPQQCSHGQWFVSGEGTRWFFDAGAPSLDFAHTGGVDERPEWERLRTPRDLAAWLAGRIRGYDGRGPVSGAVLAEGLELRAAVARMAQDAADGRRLAGHEVDVVNRFAARPDVPRWLEGGRGQGRAEARAPTLRQVLSSVARDAVDVFDAHLDRVRECGADDCPLVFLDLSRAGNRRWCSMQRCGNRHKVRSHRARALPPVSRSAT
jgi:predicted RNA-binding Zn ribbon-like protein